MKQHILLPLVLAAVLTAAPGLDAAARASPLTKPVAIQRIDDARTTTTENLPGAATVAPEEHPAGLEVQQAISVVGLAGTFTNSTKSTVWTILPRLEPALQPTQRVAADRPLVRQRE